MNIVELIQKYGLEYLGRYYSIYRGVVVSNEDPQEMDRIQVYIPSIHNGIRVWARSKASIGTPNSGVKYIPPKPGAIVFVEFEKGAPLNALWSYHSWAAGEIPEELKDTDVGGIVTPYGHKILIEDNKGKLTLQIGEDDLDKDTLVILTIEKTGKLNLKVGGDTGTTIDIEGKTTTINGGENKGLVNSDAIRSLAQALMKDLLVLGSGTNLSTWMGSDMVTKLEDPNVSH